MQEQRHDIQQIKSHIHSEKPVFTPYLNQLHSHLLIGEHLAHVHGLGEGGAVVVLINQS